ncbi:hypothetical protein KNE206_13300 [Kitasatospora sp. NE20-6]|uniref:peptidoglycan recognition protein family protein n=1 Tax=Kitasatospora sp. NE20-6 TaxID=2859066 RepID=UPI0034DC0624
MQLVTRTQWGAPAATPAVDLPAARGVKVHWIGGPYSTPDHGQCAAKVRSIRAEHLADKVNDWVDIAYNFLACGHGYVFEGRGLRKQSGANGNQELNRAHYAVCAIVGTGETAGPGLLTGLRDAVDHLRANGAGAELLGHRDGYSTECPGDALHRWVRAGAPRPDGPAPADVPAGRAAPPWADYDGHPLRNFTQSDRARMWQAYMAWRGWRITVDGRYGDASEAVCRAFQAECNAAGYPVGAVDGVVGARTWAATRNRPVSR